MRNLPIRLKLRAAFTLAIGMAFIILIIRLIYDQNKSETADIANALEKYKTLALQNSKDQQEFLHMDCVNEQYYITGTSDKMIAHQKWKAKMGSAITEIQNLSVSKALDLDDLLYELNRTQIRSFDSFDKLANATTLVGYKDYGITGEMREFAHQLEDSFPEFLKPELLLMLRRHEKDFIIRKEEKYASKFFDLYRKISVEMNSTVGSSNGHDAKIIIDQYAEAFGKLYQHSKRIGLTSGSGLKSDLADAEQNLLDQTDQLLVTISERSKNILLRLQIYFWIAISGCLLTLMALVNYLARLLSRPVLILSQHVDQFVSSDFGSNIKIESFENRRDEFGGLYNNFKKLAEEITVSFKDYRQNAEQKQAEVLEKTQKIEAQRKQLETHKNLLIGKNTAIMDSIRYAQRLQEAIFPSSKHISEILGDYTLIFKPKDVVSGDFYWIYETPDSIFWAVGDCTGHGVPGAFMSILGYTFLKQAVADMDLRETHDILDYLNMAISELLNKNNGVGEIKDGMDIALCRYIKRDGVLQFSGANRPLCIIRNGNVEIYKSDRLPVGWYFEKARAAFTSKQIQLEDSDLIYLFSDGYYDQFGGSNDKKLKFNSFKSLLTELHPFDHQANYRLLMFSLDHWQQKTEQVDDICVLGIGTAKLKSYSAAKHISKNVSTHVPKGTQTEESGRFKRVK